MQILITILLILFSGVTLLALLGALHLLLPIPIEKAHQKLENALGLSFLLGLVNLIFFIVIIALCIYLGKLTGGGSVASIPVFFAALILAVLAVFTLVGLVAMAKMLGERMGKNQSPLWCDLSGGLILIMAGLAPYIGWFVFTPAVVCASLGSAILAFFQRKQKVTVE